MWSHGALSEFLASTNNMDELKDTLQSVWDDLPQDSTDTAVMTSRQS